MKLQLLQKWMDPRTGVPITHLADFSRAKAEIRRCLVPARLWTILMSFAAEFRRNGRLFLSRFFGDSMGASATALDNQTSLR